ncbi:TetR/AcrR family transcriptional regulator C-terminal domain-containing protein [Rhodococcus sp. NPDC127530]|uniref:TetR/AcrR family transcriptional regulator C-terminal domain-containing protein n=1 Tax=unclassified Rhodococcus (in: high G+C Gram-positive bacteria) TaxID=192944 RepID=UPI00363E9586
MTDAVQTSTRRGRPPAGQSVLSRDAILEAAMSVIDDDGVETLSMRTVARRLGVDPKSLYNHVANKDALLDGIAELILSRMMVPEPLGSLREDITAIAWSFRDAALAGHPRAARLVLTRPVESLMTLAPLEAALATFIRAGASPDFAVHGLRTTLAFITGTLLREVETALTFAQSDPAKATARQQALESVELPSVHAAATYLATCDHEQEFEFGLTLLADAFERRVCTDRRG